MVRLLVTLLIVVSSFALGEEIVAVGTHFPYILDESESGELSGLSVDILSEIEHILGGQFDTTVYPWARAQNLIRQQEADILIGPYKTPERERFMTFSARPFYLDEMALFVRKDHVIDWRGDFEALAGEKIGITTGWAYGPAFDAAKDKLLLDDPTSIESNFLKLLAGRVDVVPCNVRNANVIIEKFGMETQVFRLLPNIHISQGYFSFAKKDALTDFIPQFDAAFDQLIENGTYHRLLRKYHLLQSPDQP